MASLLLLPRNCVSLGASGAVFGLFTLSVLIKLAAGFQPKKLVEAAILGQFVLAQLQQEARVSLGLYAMYVVIAERLSEQVLHVTVTNGASMLRAGAGTVCIDRRGRNPGNQHLACCSSGRSVGWCIARLRPHEATRVISGVSSWLSNKVVCVPYISVLTPCLHAPRKLEMCMIELCVLHDELTLLARVVDPI